MTPVKWLDNGSLHGSACTLAYRDWRVQIETRRVAPTEQCSTNTSRPFTGHRYRLRLNRNLADLQFSMRDQIRSVPHVDIGQM